MTLVPLPIMILFDPVVRVFHAFDPIAILYDPLVTTSSPLTQRAIFLLHVTEVFREFSPSQTFSIPRKCMRDVVVDPVQISNRLFGVVVPTHTFPAFPVAAKRPVYPVSI